MTTRLLDSGYLETDDPVVAACFLGKGFFPTLFNGKRSFGIMTLLLVSPDGVLPGVDVKFPYFIPAATVAEVYGQGMTAPAVGLQEVVLFQATHGLRAWLRQHTEEKT